MNSEERKIKLKEIQSNSEPCRTGIPIMYHGQIKTFNAYSIPLEYLVYNPYNGRIGSVVKSFERQYHALNPEDAEDKKRIEQFLWDSKQDANKKTKERLLKEHQQKHGIVTSDGIIIDGNRRASLLNKIWNDDSIPYGDKSHCQYFIAIILPDDADKKENLALETTYQMGEDAKVDYNPIEKYLKCKDLRDAGFTIEDIADMMDTKPNDIRTMLSALELMDEYLDTYGYTGMYTQLDKSEDSFLKLDSALKKYKSGVSKMWDYDPESDVSDLKLVAFDYIRLGFDQLSFRDIISVPTDKKPASSFFAKKEVWEHFRDAHFDITDNIEEKSVEDIRNTQPKSLTEALKARDREWQRRVSEGMKDNFNQSIDSLSNHANAAKPLIQLKKARQALEVVDTTQSTFCSPEAIECVKTIEEYINRFKSILKI